MSDKKFEITDFPEIAALNDPENFVFYVKRVNDGQDYKIKLRGLQGLITGTISEQGQDFVNAIADSIIPDIESKFEQDLEDQVAAAIASEPVQKSIDERIEEILGTNYENPYHTITAEVNAIIDNARTEKKFTKELKVLNETILTDVNQKLKELNDVVLVKVNEDLDGLNQELQDAFPIDEEDIKDNAISSIKIKAGAITAEKILAKSIGADKIVANSITGDLIQANTISGDNIIGNTITGDLIAANTIAGDNIVANTLTGDLIQSNAIDAVHIKAQAIETDAIKTGAIVADKIAIATITGDKIASNTITAKQIIISDFDNLAEGGNFEDPELTPFVNDDRVTPLIYDTDEYHSGTQSLVVPADGSQHLRFGPEGTLDLNEGDQIFVRFWTKSTADYNGTGNAKLRIGRKSDNAFLGAITYGNNPDWTEKTFEFTAPYTGAYTVSLWQYHTQGTIWFDDFSIRKKKNGELIVDGSITASQIAADAITATKIQADALNGKIITGSLIRTSASGSVPRVLVGDPSFPLWYGTGTASTNNMLFGLLSDGSIYAKNMVIEGTSVFKGQLIGATGTFAGSLQAATGTFSGNLSAATITGGNINGTNVNGITGDFENLRTSSDGILYLGEAGNGIRGFMTGNNHSSPYCMYFGDASKSIGDGNATFYIKKDGSGFLKGEFFQGEISESVYDSRSGNTAYAYNHISKGYDVVITATHTFNVSRQSTIRPSTRTVYWYLYRNGTQISSGNKAFGPIYEQESGTYFIVENGDINIEYVDRNNPSGDLDYKFQINHNYPSGTSRRTTCRTFESLTG